MDDKEKMVEKAIIEENLVGQVMNKYKYLLPLHLRDEAESVIFECIGRAALAFDATKGVKFSTYAWKWCFGGIKNMLKKELKGYMTYVPKDECIKYDTLSEDVCDTYNTFTEKEELAENKEYSKLNLEERAVLTLFNQGYYIANIAEKMECSSERVKRILHRIAQKNNLIK